MAKCKLDKTKNGFRLIRLDGTFYGYVKCSKPVDEKRLMEVIREAIADHGYYDTVADRPVPAEYE